METIRHNRKREKRGTIKSFYDLSEKVQNRFKLITKEIKSMDESIDNVYVFGSYYWGWWDKESDYDVLIQDAVIDKHKLKVCIKEKYDFDVDVMYGKSNPRSKELISIPL